MISLGPEPRPVVRVSSAVATIGVRTASLLVALALTGCVAAVPVAPVPGGAVGVYQYDTLPPNYYGQLNAYGTWRAVPGYGNIWCPAVPSSWTPYYYDPFPSWNFTFFFGDWVSTPYGWGWVPGRHQHGHARSDTRIAADRTARGGA